MHITIMEVSAFLENNHPFSLLDRAALQELAQQCELRAYKTGEVVYRLGEDAECFFLIYSGEVQVTRPTSASELGMLALTRFQEGDFFGARALLEGAQQLDSVTPLQPTTLLVVERAVIIKLAQECEPLSAHIALQNSSLQLLHKRGRQPGLRPQEPVTLFCVPHWACLVQRTLVPIFLLGGAVFGAAGLAVNDLQWWPLVLASGLVFPAWIALLVVDLRDDAYLVTDRRVVSDERLMIIHKTRAEAPLKRVRSVEVSQGTIAQIFGYGNVVIQAFAGQVVFRNVANPTTVRELILERSKRVRNEARIVDQQAISETIRSGLGWHPPEQGQSATQSELHELQSASERAAEAAKRYFLPRFREQHGTAVTWRKHPLRLVRRLCGSVLGIVFMSFVVVAGPGSYPIFAGRLPWAGFVVLGYGLFTFWAWYQFEDWRADVYTLNSERLIDAEKKPLLGRLTQRSAPIESVLNVSYARPGIIANIFNYGTVTIETGGETGRLTFEWVGNPLSVQQEIFLRLEQYFEQREGEESQQRQREIADWLTAYADVTQPPKPD